MESPARGATEAAPGTCIALAFGFYSRLPPQLGGTPAGFLIKAWLMEEVRERDINLRCHRFQIISARVFLFESGRKSACGDSRCLASLLESPQPRGFGAALPLAFSGKRAKYHLRKSQSCYFRGKKTTQMLATQGTSPRGGS